MPEPRIPRGATGLEAGRQRDLYVGTRSSQVLPLKAGPGMFPRIRRHPLLGSARLIVDRSTVAQGGMQPPVIVIAKIAAQREPQPAFRRKPGTVHELGLQGVKERLHVRVVARR